VNLIFPEDETHGAGHMDRPYVITFTPTHQGHRRSIIPAKAHGRQFKQFTNNTNELH
jgi:hypothetical protein